MSLTFYFSPMSTATVTQLVLEELGVPCERVQLDLKQGDAQKPDFVKLNPNAKVPVIVHDGAVIWESSAITMYLGETFGVDKQLYPAPGPQRGEAMKWITWANVTLTDAVMRWARNTTEWVPAEQHNAKAGEAGLQDLHGCLKILDEALAGRAYLLGDDYTLADTHLHAFTDWVRYMEVDFTAYTRLEQWSQRCTSRPAYGRVMAGAAGG